MPWPTPRPGSSGGCRTATVRVPPRCARVVRTSWSTCRCGRTWSRCATSSTAVGRTWTSCAGGGRGSTRWPCPTWCCGGCGPATSPGWTRRCPGLTCSAATDPDPRPSPSATRTRPRSPPRPLARTYSQPAGAAAAWCPALGIRPAPRGQEQPCVFPGWVDVVHLRRRPREPGRQVRQRIRLDVLEKLDRKQQLVLAESARRDVEDLGHWRLSVPQVEH